MATATRARPPRLPSDAEVLGRAGSENFVVASRLLPAASRGHLLAFYGYARLVDQLGDDYRGDRLEALRWASAEVDAAMADPATAGLHPLIAAAATAARAVGLDATPLHDLIEANRLDQHVIRYATWSELLGYCRLSANPVGRLVLAAFAATDPAQVGWSDQICSALQVAEHIQDVGEDAVAGRVYLPAEDLERFGVDPDGLADLARSCLPAPVGLKAAIGYETARTRALLDAGAPLVATLAGRARLAVAGFVAGGYAALDAVAEAGYDPLSHPSAPRRSRVALHLVRLLRPAPRSAS